MAEYTWANLDEWVAKTERRLDAVWRQSVSDMLAGIEVVVGKTRGGDPQVGEIPRDSGLLANSLFSELTGSTILSASGADSYLTAVSASEAGDVMVFSWIMEYAARLHYGFVGTDSQGRQYNQPGLMWVDTAVAKWPDYVREAVKRARTQE